MSYCPDCGSKRKWVQLFTSADWYCEKCEDDKTPPMKPVTSDGTGCHHDNLYRFWLDDGRETQACWDCGKVLGSDISLKNYTFDFYDDMGHQIMGSTLTWADFSGHYQASMTDINNIWKFRFIDTAHCTVGYTYL